MILSKKYINPGSRYVPPESSFASYGLDTIRIRKRKRIINDCSRTLRMTWDCEFHSFLLCLELLERLRDFKRQMLLIEASHKCAVRSARSKVFQFGEPVNSLDVGRIVKDVSHQCLFARFTDTAACKVVVLGDWEKQSVRHFPRSQDPQPTSLPDTPSK